MLKEEVLTYIKENKLNIEDVNDLIADAIAENGIEELLEFLAGQDYIRNLAIGLTQYSFRSGPIEDMHSGTNPKHATEDTSLENISQLSQEDMKKLNKYMVDKLGFLLHLLVEGRYFEMATLLQFPILLGSQWDSPNIEKEEKDFEKLLTLMKKNSY
ncbi:hypothetical protein P8610_19535 [Fictibacillus sp. UD]|uniref:hypothetical protein n=1 Tax=Fictibacillus sp. UD TaxID=3038777 RepID=UPI00374644F0